MATVHSIGGATPPQPPRVPHNVDAEAALLGAMLIDNGLADDMVERLDAEHFYDPAHARIFERIRDVRRTGMIASPVTLRPMFDGDELLATRGGTQYLVEITGSNASLIGARQFAQQIYDLAQLRALITVGRTLVENATDTSTEVDPKKQIEAAEEALFKVAAEGSSANAVKSFAQATTMAVRMAERAMNSGGGLSGVTTGLDSVNGRIGGMHHSDLIILAGRPGMGKTSLATNIAFNAAQRYMDDQRAGMEKGKSVGAKVAFFSLEMSADQLATRIMAEQAEISSEALRMGKIRKEDFTRLANAAADLEQLPLYIDDTAGLSISGLHTRVRRLQRKLDGELGLVVVDYLQLLQGSGKGSDNRVQEISEISRGLKTLAKDIGVPVMALSQLSRAVEQREDKRPQLSDLRESGSIEQDADVVLLVHRPDFYDKEDRPGEADIIMAKHRNGPTETFHLAFLGAYSKFKDMPQDYNSDQGV